MTAEPAVSEDLAPPPPGQWPALARLRSAVHDRLRALFAQDVVRGRDQAPEVGRTLEVELSRPERLGMVRLSEDIGSGRAVVRYSVSGCDGTTWTETSRGTTIGYARIDEIANTGLIQRLKGTVTDAVGDPAAVRISAYARRASGSVH